MTLITAHPTLVELKKRLRARHLLEKLRLGVLVGASGGSLLCLGGRLVGYDQWHIAAIAWLMVSMAGTAIATLKGWPGNWAAARAADGLGLEERVASALYAADVEHPASHLLAGEAQRGLDRLSPADYPVIPDSRRWFPVLLAAGLMSITALIPLPVLGEGGRQAAEAATVAATRKSVEELQARLIPSPVAEPLAQKTEAELESLEKQLAEARSAAEAAKALEESQERLASLAQQEHYAWERALDGLTSAWGESADLGALAGALADRDAEAAEKALAELSAREEDLSSDERQRLQVALQKGANAARDVPSLASALRDAASRMGAKNDEGNGGTDEAQEALDDLATTLAEGVRGSVGLKTTQNAMAGLGQARSTLGAMPTGAASAAAPRGTGSASAGGAQQAGGSASGGGEAGNSDSVGDSNGGTGSGSGSGGGENSANSGGSGMGSGSGSGSSSGVGGSGSGTGAGAGVGGGPSPGKPGSADAGSTAAGAGAGIAPSERGSTQYERIYAPSFIGGEGGPKVQTPGDAAGASGDTVEMPESDVSLGSLKPYNEVFGEYEAAARESASRKQLPPAMQTLVQRYFSAIKPEE